MVGSCMVRFAAISLYNFSQYASISSSVSKSGVVSGALMKNLILAVAFALAMIGGTVAVSAITDSSPAYADDSGNGGR